MNASIAARVGNRFASLVERGVSVATRTDERARLPVRIGLIASGSSCRTVVVATASRYESDSNGARLWHKVGASSESTAGQRCAGGVEPRAGEASRIEERSPQRGASTSRDVTMGLEAVKRWRVGGDDQDKGRGPSETQQRPPAAYGSIARGQETVHGRRPMKAAQGKGYGRCKESSAWDGTHARGERGSRERGPVKAGRGGAERAGNSSTSDERRTHGGRRSTARDGSGGSSVEVSSGNVAGRDQASIMKQLKQARNRRDGKEAKRVLDKALDRADSADVVDVFVFSAAVGVFAKTGEWEAALGVLSVMKKRGVPPNEFTYNQAITACGNGGQWRWAVYLLKAMPTVGITPDVVSYNAAIAACGKVRQYELAVILLREMAEKGVTPNTLSYSTAISAVAACGSAQHWKLVTDLLEEMPEKIITPDAACYGSAIAACEAGGQFDLALRLLEQMYEMDGITPDLKSYNAAISACGKAGQWEQGVVLLKQMQDNGTHPDSLSYNTVVEACRKGDQPDVVEGLLREMQTLGIELSVAGSNNATI